MLKVRTLTVQIARPVATIYEFLVDPSNLPRWTMVEHGVPQPDMGDHVWSFDGPRGRVLAQFTPPNAYYVLDYTVYQNGQTLQAASVRLIPNGAGSVLTHTSMQQETVSDLAFASEAEWMLSDLMVLKSLMETT